MAILTPMLLYARTFLSNSPSNYGWPHGPGAITVTGLPTACARKAVGVRCLEMASSALFNAIFTDCCSVNHFLQHTFRFKLCLLGLMLLCSIFCHLRSLTQSSVFAISEHFPRLLCCWKGICWLEKFEETHVSLLLLLLVHVAL